MEIENIGCDYMIRYRNISSKLKKRFLRKPNVAEASEEFGQLARSLSEGEAWAQSGLCCVAVARCEQTLANSSTEVSALIQAARFFMKAECSNYYQHCPSFNEHLITAISCYQHAIQLYIENEKVTLACSLYIELGKALMELDQPSEALTHLRAAADILAGSPLDHVTCLGRIATCKLQLGDLDGALTTFAEINEIIAQSNVTPLTGAYEDILARSEISSLLILLTLKPLPQQTKPHHTELLEKYSWTSESQSPEVPYDDPELCILLQSLVLACQGKDLEALASLGEHLTARLSSEQLHLLHILLTEVKRS